MYTKKSKSSYLLLLLSQIPSLVSWLWRRFTCGMAVAVSISPISFERHKNPKWKWVLIMSCPFVLSYTLPSLIFISSSRQKRTWLIPFKWSVFPFKFLCSFFLPYPLFSYLYTISFYKFQININNIQLAKGTHTQIRRTSKWNITTYTTQRKRNKKYDFNYCQFNWKF